MSVQLLIDLEHDEAYSGFPYQDTEKLWTFAIGRCLETNPLSGAEWKALLDAGEMSVHISKEGADRLLGPAVDAIRIQCVKSFRWYPALTPARQDAIANMVYNLGFVKFLLFRKALDALNAGDFDLAANEFLNSRWAEQVGARARRIANIIRTGVRP